MRGSRDLGGHMDHMENFQGGVVAGEANSRDGK
jgi:hypothetical protein